MSWVSIDIEDCKTFSKALHEYVLMADVYRDTGCNVYVDQAVCKDISKLIDAKMDSMVKLVDRNPGMTISDPLDHAHRLAGALAKLGIVMTDNSARAKLVSFLLQAAEAESKHVPRKEAASSDDDSKRCTVELISFEGDKIFEHVRCFSTRGVFLQFSMPYKILHLTSHRLDSDNTSQKEPFTITLVLKDTLLITAVDRGDESRLTLFSRVRDEPVRVWKIGFTCTAHTRLMKNKLADMGATSILRPNSLKFIDDKIIEIMEDMYIYVGH